jgi:carbon-monoxide dehydrogenase large subunit
MPDGAVGRSIKRLEDAELLVGAGSFIDDIAPKGVLHASFVRSAYAHARIVSVDCTSAKDRPGVIGVYTIDDFLDVLTTDRVPETFPKPRPRKEVGAYVLAREEVCYVGEPIVLVIAETRYQAEDAAALVSVEYKPLDAILNCKDAVLDQSPLADTRNDGNIFSKVKLGYGDCESVFNGSAEIISETFFQHRGVSMSMECRGLVAHFHGDHRKLTMWSSCQQPHGHKAILVDLFGLTEDQVRVVVPSLGGGFGPKLNFYPEDAAVVAASIKTRRPIKWVEDRREHILATTQERDQVWDVELAASPDGRLLGLRGRLYHDQGAYTVRGTNIPFSAATTILGPYVLPNYSMDVVVAHTNKVPSTSMRGAGHPQGNFVMERLLDLMADRLGVDRADIRSRNMISAAQMPYEQPLKTQAGQRIVYDSGDYLDCQAELMRRLRYSEFPDRQAAAKSEGRYIGMAIANYVKPTGRGPFESGIVRIGTSGLVSVYTGAVAMGQGFRTAMAQLCAEQLGVKPSDVLVIAGDTQTVSHGIGGFASRQTVCAGSAIYLAAAQVRKKVLSVAAHLLEASEADLDLEDGNVFVSGVPDICVGFKDIANAVAGIPGVSLPEGISAGLESEMNFKPENVTYANGSHGCEVEVDPETGAVKVVKYLVIHDSGRLLNPLIVDGQVHGGVTLGLGHSFFEQVLYDEMGQPLTTNLAEYLIPTASEVPNYEVVHQESPTERNPIGVKGVGECGVMAAMPVLLSAVESALRDFDIKLNRYPVTPAMIAEHIRAYNN